MAVIGAADGTGIGPAKDDADQRAGSASPGAKLTKADCIERCPLSGVTRKTFAPLSSSEFTPGRTWRFSNARTQFLRAFLCSHRIRQRNARTCVPTITNANVPAFAGPLTP